MLLVFLLCTSSQKLLAEEFEIKHADLLDAENQEINIKGNIIISYKDALIEAPEGKILSNTEGKPEKAIFLGRAKLKSKDKKLEANRIVVYLNTETIYADGNVSSELKDSTGNLIFITSDFQELGWNGENANARGNIKVKYKDSDITSDEAKVIYKDKKPNQAIFTGSKNQAHLVQPNYNTKANELVFDIDTNNIQAFGNVSSTIWPYKPNVNKKQDFVSLTADDLFIDHASGTIIAKSKSKSKKVQLTYQDTNGESNEAVLLRDKSNEKPEKIIFRGNAAVKQTDKQLTSEEVVFNFADKKLTSNTITNVRPKTLIFKMS